MKSSNFLSGLTLFALLNLLLINSLLPRIFPNTFSGDTIFYLQGWADAPGKHKGQGDSWTPMTAAYQFNQANPEGLIYSKIFFEEKTKFQYPPTSLFIMSPLSRLAPDQTFRLINGLNWVSWIFVLMNGPLAAAIFYVSWRKANGDWPAGWRGWTMLFIIVLLGSSFYPMLRGYHIGQVQVWLNGMAGLLILFWLWGWEAPSGVLVGLMCLFKPQYGVIYLWGVARFRVRFMIAGAIAGGSGVILSLILFGWGNHLDYFPAVSFMSRHGEVFYANQSVNGLLNRWFLTGPVLGFLMTEFAAYHPAVYWGTLISSLGLVVIALAGPFQSGKDGHSVFDLCIALMIGTMASPIAWEHHYGILLPIYAVLTPLLYKEKPWGGWTWPLFGLSYLLTSNYFILFNRFADSRLNILLSYLFFGALLLLGLLLTYRYQPTPSSTDQNAQETVIAKKGTA